MRHGNWEKTIKRAEHQTTKIFYCKKYRCCQESPVAYKFFTTVIKTYMYHTLVLGANEKTSTTRNKKISTVYYIMTIKI